MLFGDLVRNLLIVDGDESRYISEVVGVEGDECNHGVHLEDFEFHVPEEVLFGVVEAVARRDDDQVVAGRLEAAVVRLDAEGADH